MSDTDDLHYYVRTLERDLAQYHDALEKHLFETELARIERSHARVHLVAFIGSMWAAIALIKWLEIDYWLAETVVYFVAFIGLFIIIIAITAKPMQREIDNISKPLAWLPKPRWRENNN